MSPPPRPPAITRVPCEHEVCYDKTNAGKLRDWAYAIDAWAEEAWQTCGGQ